MKLEFDPTADAAYFEISSSEVESSKEIEAGIIVDYDKHGHVIGVEVLSVSKRTQGINTVFPSKPLQNAVAAHPAG
ncbi:MAG: DUF2283 domain-containing protein [Gammaproteobacteria bacterium]|nr:DUF2283 domain-containing protein [Gammaproteobacteria bacterium]